MANPDQTTILVIDDELQLVRVLVRLLSVDGYLVQSARDAVHAFTAIAVRIPDLILLDAWLPSGSGVKLCRALRASEATAQTPIIMFTGMDTPELRHAAETAGATAFVTKPCPLTTLRALVRSLLMGAQHDHALA